MKVTNTSAAGLTISISFENAFGSYNVVELAPGKVVFAEDNQPTKSVVIQQRKGNISVSNEACPTHLNLYEAYSPDKVNVGFLEKVGKTLVNLFTSETAEMVEVDPLANVQEPSEELTVFEAPDKNESDWRNELETLPDDKIAEEEAFAPAHIDLPGNIPFDSADLVEPALVPEFEEEVTPEVLTDGEKKRGRGRPPGAKNKPKRGRPRKK